MLKRGGSDYPIDACKGWFDPCDYCDKRFCEWMPTGDDIYEKIPETPGFFMIALKNKNITEVVAILYSQNNLQKVSISKIDRIKEQISNKKMKATKSEILVRWLALKEAGDKDSVMLCCHWNNTGILPRFSTAWPGQKLMEESEDVVFSKQIQKWYYPQKNPVWRKEKAPPSKNFEEVQKCNFQSCGICDDYFTPWESISDVVAQNQAPDDTGLVMISAVYGKNREVLEISSERNNVVKSIKCTIENVNKNSSSYLSSSKFGDKNAFLQVRWSNMRNIDNDNACFLFAHFQNAEKWPKFNADCSTFGNNELGEQSLDKNRHFVLRTKDKKWCYEREALKKAKFSKVKNRKQLFDELYAEEEDEVDHT